MHTYMILYIYIYINLVKCNQSQHCNNSTRTAVSFSTQFTDRNLYLEASSKYPGLRQSS